MTAQISDTVQIRGEEYLLIGHNARGLFHPQSVGISPNMISTACYEGFYSTYEFAEDVLYLKELTVRDANNEYPPINGVAARATVEGVFYADQNGEWQHRIETDDTVRIYSDVRMRIPYTGKLRLAKDLLPELYIHMGYQKASAFRVVVDITLFQGKIAAINDRSAEMEKKRGQFKKAYDAGDFLDTINDAFSLELDLE